MGALSEAGTSDQGTDQGTESSKADGSHHDRDSDDDHHHSDDDHHQKN